MTSTTLTEIPFHNQFISAYRNEDGEAYVALKPICENMGIDFNGQYQRLKRAEWAVMCMTHTTGADGKTYDMVAIDRQTFTMWLATIDTPRIRNEEAKRLVVLYQQEAAKVLEQHFFGDSLRNTEDERLLRETIAINARLEETLRKLTDVLATIGAATADGPTPMQSTQTLPSAYTLTERWYLQQIKEHGYAIPGDCPFPDPMTAHKAMIQRFGLQTSTKRVHVEGQERKVVRRVLLPSSLTPTV